MINEKRGDDFEIETMNSNNHLALSSYLHITFFLPYGREH